MRKQIFFLLILICVSIPTFGQEEDHNENDPSWGFEKNDFFASGSIYYQYGSDNIDRTSSIFRFSPSAGYFVSNHLSLNAGLVFVKTNFEDSPNNFTNDRANTGFSLGATYFFTPEKQFSFTTSLLGTFMNENTDIVDNGNTSASTEVKESIVQLSPGISYFITQRFVLQLNVGAIFFRKIRVEFNDSGSYQELTNFVADLNLSNITFSFTYKF